MDKNGDDLYVVKVLIFLSSELCEVLLMIDEIR